MRKENTCPQVLQWPARRHGSPTTHRASVFDAAAGVCTVAHDDV
jgi:hypothetical protein